MVWWADEEQCGIGKKRAVCKEVLFSISVWNLAPHFKGSFGWSVSGNLSVKIKSVWREVLCQNRFFLHLYWISTSHFCWPLLVKVLLCVSLELLMFAAHTSAVFSSYYPMFCFILALCSMSEIKLGMCCFNSSSQDLLSLPLHCLK